MSADVLDARRGGHCPRCGNELTAPEVDPEKGTYIDRLGDYWCAGCGWSDEDPATPTDKEPGQ